MKDEMPEEWTEYNYLSIPTPEEVKEDETIDSVVHWSHPNRTKSRQASKEKFWCGSCDRAMVGEFGKCPVCGSRNHPKKRKL